jgi:hypothetical protein
MCERLSISRLRGDPGVAFDEIRREYMEEQSPEPYENNPTRLPASSWMSLLQINGPELMKIGVYN